MEVLQQLCQFDDKIKAVPNFFDNFVNC